MMVKILSFSNDGVLNVVIRNKRYTYFNVSPYMYHKLDTLINHKNWSSVFKTLKGLSQNDSNGRINREGEGLFSNI